MTEQRKSRKDRRTAKQMHADLVQLGYDGSFERVAVFVRTWKGDRQRAHLTTDRGTFVPLVFQPGEAFQFDWSEDWAHEPETRSSRDRDRESKYPDAFDGSLGLA
ncbi:hypothetical protein XM52_06070 [Roseovarius indicus]|uniref:Transposase n=1 Tax=Roseovarius indicus TaxID=540747 RepID=A0A0T5PDH0_9RHOB|nr:hypothetical protein XM52_06070 [Roseovarius indicus]